LALNNTLPKSVGAPAGACYDRISVARGNISHSVRAIRELALQFYANAYSDLTVRGRKSENQLLTNPTATGRRKIVPLDTAS